MKVGFIGLGRMGQAMAARILGGGHDLVVFNRSRDKAAELEKNGAKVASSIAEACRGREVVISMVSDDKALTEVVKEISGALEKSAIHVAMGTHGVHVLREVDAVHGRLARSSSHRRCSAVLKPRRRQINIVPAGRPMPSRRWRR
jgi:3-hydroxyisobutyrate dehydrogenase-like beta-hydroxyacid dehydrogenase